MNQQYKRYSQNSVTINIALFSILLVLSLAVSAQREIDDLKPTVLLISIDGFRADYFEIHKPFTLNELARNGVRAKWMKPPYPTKTFPAHYTIATGLYPDNHGMVENNMFDVERNAVFGLSDRNAVQDPLWWGGEPIWNTVQKQGQIAASFFWPGTETAIGGMQPKYWKQYDGNVSNTERVDTLLSWLDLPQAERPTILTIYFSDVDDAGHGFGPDSPETKAAVIAIDQMIKRLMDGLSLRGIADKVNIIITSDHGMAPYRMRDAIVLDEMFDTNDAERIFWVGEFTQIFPKPGREDVIYRAIKAKLPKNAFIYRRHEFPRRFKFGKNKRIAPLVVIPTEGTVITTRQRFERAEREGRLDAVRGAHGYDNDLVSMRATFVGHGPRFKRNFISEPFESVDVYELICRILEIRPSKNDGKFKRIRSVLR
ncbi:ectonucleotide pyrophosphatase/phosphodiesterase [Leptolyngbya sp. 7M]|uniref:alkaline phosphatase family protein n=1 Tax=Leptolyngbya sp. 7M TaxID=2812896 RepID=UPI001B8A9C39|nr:ectonucleotide pyrophosphatase/phosphodiesterase [Leptolyngbya sp. 7M]QYO68213.1 ectonucleotide pyrophosphatase/phosphodiesterase [Leptolyngbya sp. 7M]